MHELLAFILAAAAVAAGCSVSVPQNPWQEDFHTFSHPTPRAAWYE